MRIYGLVYVYGLYDPESPDDLPTTCTRGPITKKVFKKEDVNQHRKL